jgi:hypothetical protein
MREQQSCHHQAQIRRPIVLIDWHVHINDPKYMGPPYWKNPVPMTLEHALAAHELASLDRTVISNAVHYLRFCKTTKEVVAALESSNRYLAKCRDQHPEKFVAMASAFRAVATNL